MTERANDWMMDADPQIIALLEDTGLELTPSNIAHNIGYSSGYTRKRCKELAERGLLDAVTNSPPFYSVVNDE